MNSATHSDICKEAIRLVLAHGCAPAARDLLLTGHAEFFEAATLPDRITEIACRLVGGKVVTELWGRNLASLGHYQCVTRGYRFIDDASLSVCAEVIAAAAALSDAHIVPGDNTVPAPLSGLLEPSPIQLAVDRQRSVHLGGFCFPSAGEEAEYWCASVRHWLADGNLVAARRSAGMLAHYIADACIPHHAWGANLDGHEAFENDLEVQTRDELVSYEWTSTWHLLANAVRSELADITATTVVDLCEEQAVWALRVFGERRWLDTVEDDKDVRLLVRALAATVRGLEIAMEVAA